MARSAVGSGGTTEQRRERTYGIGEGSKSELGQRAFVMLGYRSSKKECRLEAVDGWHLEESGRGQEKARLLEEKS
jgi:hypothetical protein